MTYTHLVHVAKAYRITADIVVSTLYFYQVYLFAYTGERLTFRVRVMAFAAMLRQVRVASNQVITLLLFLTYRLLKTVSRAVTCRFSRMVTCHFCRVIMCRFSLAVTCPWYILFQEVGWFDEKSNQVGTLTSRLANDASRIKGVSIIDGCPS